MRIRLAAPIADMPSEPRSPWGPRASTGSFHNGVDLAVPIGTELHAMTAGTVVGTLYDVREDSGIAVIVQDDSGRVRWSFSHCSALVVVKGDRVTRGQAIAYSGNTGHVIPAPSASCPDCGAHVHVRVDVDGVNVDPWPLFKSTRASGAKALGAIAVGVFAARRFL